MLLRAAMQTEISSPLLKHPRTLWVQPARSGVAADCLIFLDGELYRDRVGAMEIVERLQSNDEVPSINSVYLSNAGAAARHVDFTCNEAFSVFLARDLKGWIDERVGPHQRYILCGLSLSGLAAAYTMRQHPSAFYAALCQSPSAWWHGEWLAASWPSSVSRQGRFWVSVGDQERQHGVVHSPTGLFQNVSQLDSCRRLVQTLSERGHEVHYSEYAGGHDPKCWGDELPNALKWLLASSGQRDVDDLEIEFSTV